jgi:hypothetical protein
LTFEQNRTKQTTNSYLFTYGLYNGILLFNLILKCFVSQWVVVMSRTEKKLQPFQDDLPGFEKSSERFAEVRL